MACFHFAVKSHSRGKGHSATAAAAYRAGMRIEDPTTGLIHDYTRRSGVVSVDMFAPKDAPEWARDPSQLWSRVEEHETRKNARVAREFVIALPHELDPQGRRDLVADISQALVDRYGVAVQSAIHAPDKHGDERNHHAHILITPRQVEPGGFGAYAAKAYDDFKKGPEEILAVREMVALFTNVHLKSAGLDVRVDHRTLEDQAADAAARGDLAQAQALDRFPTIKEGRAPGQREARRAINSRIRASNEARQSKWQRWEAQAAREGRLMPASHDTRPQPTRRNHGEPATAPRTNPTSIGARGPRAPRHRARPPGRPLAYGALDPIRVRPSRDGAEPLPSVPGGHGFAVVEPRRGAEQRRDPVPRAQPRHSSDRGPLHLASGISPSAQAIAPKAKGPRAQRAANAPPGAGRALTGRAARGAVAGLAAGFGTKQRAGLWMDEYSRAAIHMDEQNRAKFQEMMRLIHELFEVPAQQVHKLFLQDLAMRERMAQRTDMTAINWRAADRDVDEARRWLDRIREEPAQRFKARDDAERRLNLAQVEHNRWHRANPEPPKRLWRTDARTAWEKAAKTWAEKLDAAKSEFRVAFQRADLPALDALDKQREHYERQERRALTTRQSLALLPSEEFLRDLEAAAKFPAMPADAPASEPDLKTDIGSAATANPTHRRWRREMSPRPPR